MNIGIYVANWHPHAGGGYVYQACLLDELRRLAQPDKSPHTFTFFHSGPLDLLIASDTELWIDVEWYQGRLNEAALRNEIDIIWFLSISYEHTDLPFIVPVWDLQHRTSPCFPEVSTAGELSTRDTLYDHFLSRATFILTGTTQGKEEIAWYYRVPQDKIIVNPLPLSEPIGTVPISITEELVNHNLMACPFLFYPAQFWPHKNHVVLLETLQKLKQQYGLQLKLVLTGSDKGNLGFVSRKVQQMNLVDDVVIMGFVETKTLCWLYRNALALLYPSFFGPDNIPPLEAFSAGCPVVAADVPGVREQLNDAAILVSPTDAQGVADAVSALTRSPQLREELIQKGYVLVADRTPSHYVHVTLNAIESFTAVRRCWDAQAITTYLSPSFSAWISHYTSALELCTLVSLLENFDYDDTGRQIFNSCCQILYEIQETIGNSVSAIQQGNYPAAKAELQEVLTHCCDYAPAYMCLALISEHLSEAKERVAYATRADFYRKRVRHSKLFDENGSFRGPATSATANTGRLS